MSRFRWIWLFLISVLLSPVLRADSQRLHVECQDSDGAISKGFGTAFCIGMTTDNKTLWVSVAHNFDNAVGAALVSKNGTKYPITNLRRDQDKDISLFESTMPAVKPFKLSDSVPGNFVQIYGYGPEYHGRTAVGFNGYILNETFIAGESGYHPIPGDSGAPAVVGDTVVGAIIGYEMPNIKTTYRSDYAERRLRTLYAPAQEIKVFLTQYYQQQSQCGPNGCYIYGRPAVIQPRAGITFPVGPPQIVGITQPIPSPRNVPAAQPQSASIPDEVIQREVSKWLSLNLDKIRGPAGNDGKDGKDGKDAAVGTAKPQLPLKVILARDGFKIDEQVVQPGDPLILDVRTLE